MNNNIETAKQITKSISSLKGFASVFSQQEPRHLVMLYALMDKVLISNLNSFLGTQSEHTESTGEKKMTDEEHE